MKTVTANQFNMISKIALSVYNGYNGEEPESIFLVPMHDVVENNKDKGTLTSLKNANLVEINYDGDNGCNYVNLTPTGFAIYKV